MERIIDDSILTDIADAIREKNGTDNQYEDAEMPQAIRDISSEDGWYDTFWDAFQLNGARDNYNCGFYDYSTPNCWTNSVIYPKYSIKGTNFANCFRDVKGELDLSARFSELDIILDTSQATSVASMFRGSDVTKVPTIDLSSIDITATSSSAGAYYIFSGCSKLHTVEKIISKENVTYSNSFQNCSALENITFEGVIDQSISFKQSYMLKPGSLDSIVGALANLVGKDSQILEVHTSIKAMIDEDNAKEDTDDTKHFWLSTLRSKNWTLA